MEGNREMKDMPAETKFSKSEEQIMLLNNEIKRLQKSERMLKVLLENSPVMVWSLDENRCFSFSDGRWLWNIGLKPEEVVGMSILELYKVYPDIVECIQKTYTGEPQSWIQKVDGKTYDAYTFPVFDEKGRVISVIGVSINVTNKRQVQKKLIEAKKAMEMSEEQLSTAFQMNPDIIFITRPDFTYVKVNNAFLQKTGRREEEVIGKTIGQCGLRIGTEKFVHFLDELLRVGEISNMEAQLEYDNGNMEYSLISTRIISVRGEKYYMFFVRDITERKRGEDQIRKSEDRFRRAATNLPIAMSYADRNLNILFTNNRFTDLFGYSIEDIPSVYVWFDKVYPNEKYRKELLEPYLDKYNNYLLGNSNGKDYSVSTIVCKDGNEKEIITETFTDGEFVYATFTDITERKRMEDHLKQSEERFRRAATNIQVALFYADLEGNILFLNNKFVELFGYTQDEIPTFTKWQEMTTPDELLRNKVQESFQEFLSEDNRAELMAAIEKTVGTGDIQLTEFKLQDRDRKEYYEVRIVPCGESEVLVICRNITDRKYMEEQLMHMSMYDSLTQLYNRTFFEKHLALAESKDSGSKGMIVCDVDGLKVINDTLGHSVGDTILQAVADLLKNIFGQKDVISRIGGDEFAIIISTGSENELAALSQQIRRHIDYYNTKNPTVSISMSIGYALGKETPVDLSALFKEADNNMYREKLHQSKSARSAIVQALMKVLEARDYLTEGHGERLQNMIQAFANELELSEANTADLRLFAHFHDIGKVGIPDSILLKAGRLTEEEWAVMRRHSEIGHSIAKSAQDLIPIADWILMHHEWWNGDGYPLGLKGEEIPLECRMLSILDAFDAMMSDRPYRKGMSREAAVSELSRCAGVQFDPGLVEKFIAMLYDEG